MRQANITDGGLPYAPRPWSEGAARVDETGVSRRAAVLT
ncbi:hypothetical protein MINT15_24390 [Saccharomonospora viridis]|uniref:Uncharacterized protein n=1 Tax=Saccharomonospora viridis TaxID=1852 RepID=A0A837DBH1_9PSEU|nr:hypothetical protein MINT15_24390 [Saccharomonospora viridis]